MLLKSVLRSSLLAVLVAQVVAANNLYPRQSNSAPPPDDPPTTPSTPPTQPSTPVVPSNPVTPPTTPSQTPTSTPTSDPPNTTPTSVSTPPPTNPDPDPATTPPPAQDTDPVIVTESDVTQTSVKTNSRSSSATSASSTPTDTGDKNQDEGIGTGAIVGMSVAGGLAVLGIIAFFVWKFTRKRFSSFDESEPIKWPDLNSHGGAPDSHPLPVRDTGRAGFGDTGSESDLSRMNQSNYSTTDFNGAHDPYAVPPLPHLNPNQPYRDDPTGAAGYYDPYRGPVPGTAENGQSWEGEAIPMNQLGHGASPGPLQAYDTGRGSPAPPNMGYQQPAVYEQYDQGRQSPGPMAAYGRASPGPNAAMGAAGYGQQPPGYR
ncbi:hypothetical protein BKA70DRAFT_1369879 [Coprinopsis sp. MPI-PUGE-AT-0042]|nr:hypothetical protein BKA70DRAFT_1369879 [Coprinopsis sp. MPI-PUGE-AT-0042]